MKDEFKKMVGKEWRKVEKELPDKYDLEKEIYIDYTTRVTLSKDMTLVEDVIDIEDIAGNNIRLLGEEEVDKLIETLTKLKKLFFTK